MLNPPDIMTSAQGMKINGLPQLPERAEVLPIANFSKHSLDRLRVVEYLWAYENSEFTRTRSKPVDMADPTARQAHVEEVFKNNDAFYAADEFHTRPPFENGVPTHGSSVPLNCDPKVIENGIQWYDKLKPDFKRIVDKI